jgi:transposase-like protein
MSAVVGLWREGGGSKKAFCASHGINVHTLNYWITKLDSQQRDSNAPIGFRLLQITQH